MSSDSLILVHVIVRHGNRTTDISTSYVNDPYKNHTFFPFGEGMLTNEGKRAVYAVGKAYRTRYNDFLGEIYLPEYLETWTSEYRRTRTSAQLFLAALFPPKGILKWHDNLNWQPIHTNYNPLETDELLAALVKTNKFKTEYRKVFENGIGKQVLRKYQDIIPYIEKNIGEKIYDTRRLWTLRDCLQTQVECGLPLPDWAKCIYPDRLLEVSHDEYRMQVCTKELKRCVCGLLLKKIYTDTCNKIQQSSDYKIHLYVGHDINIANVLEALGLMYDHLPDYAASISLEVHQIDGQYGLKVYYKKNKDADFQLMKFPNGKTIWWLQEFEKLVSDIWSSDENKA